MIAVSAGRRERAEREIATLARVLVRAGQRPFDDVLADVREAYEADLGAVDADDRARTLVLAAVTAAAEERTDWVLPTDHDRFESALSALAADGMAVLRGCADQHDAAALLREHRPSAGVLFFTETDVWHAVEHGMLEVNCWHPDGAAIGAGDPLAQALIDCFAAVALPAVFDEGRIEVTMEWQRRDLCCLTDAIGNRGSDRVPRPDAIEEARTR